ncbi:hypothetical protein K461DRAFT_6937 [Myriangium duriaei CBS 260.36]|uniref:Uncharacterized protein n=1 Tax=Myriangium duriaei CBS 260.36 TaxID=1168546 RepID=A0A9P4JC27_9PEZI|nr:hypothetical protein K461DRAFT_6937 [Myriangium duriaei CBS 260.36]
MALYAQDVETKQSSIYRSLNQGITVFHEDQYAEVDIVAVPGLGANPEESWTWTPPRKRENARYGPSNGSIESVTNEQDDVEFNWIRDAKGIASLASLCNKKSRIMLYDFASAWKGSRKVRATLKSICTVLLDCLSEKRKVFVMDSPSLRAAF